MNHRYDIDHGWLDLVRQTEDGGSATVRLTVKGPSARDAVMEWLQDVPVDALGVRGRNEWIVQEVSAEEHEAIVDITAGGGDIAASLEDATGEAFEVLDALGGNELHWQERPVEGHATE